MRNNAFRHFGLRIADCGLKNLPQPFFNPKSAIQNPKSSAFFFLASILLISGCTYNSTNTTPDAQSDRQKQEAALRDPMNYKPDDSTDPYDISGGGINNMDSKALKRDLDDVLNP